MINSMFKISLILGLIFTVISCEKEEAEEPVIDPCNLDNQAGELLDASYIFTITPEQIEGFLSQSGGIIPIGLTVDYTVDIYRVSYMTSGKSGELTPVSGVMFIPQGMDTLDLISVQHGTVFQRDQVGSVSPFPSALDGLIVAMNGYWVVEPDYLGLGDSEILHPYLHARLSANPVIDMIRAARIYSCENEYVLSEHLFLAGYSEGGYVTLATQKIIETELSDEFQLTAVAPMSGPHDLLGSTRSLLALEEYDNPAYLVYMVAAYNDIYGWDRLSEIIQEPYASSIPELLDGSRDGAAINDSLPKTLDSLFTSTFVSSFLGGQDTELEFALIANSPVDWGPIAPVRLIHGTADSTVFYSNSVFAYESMKANGGLSIDLVPLPGADHESAAFFAYYFALQWFDSLRVAN